MNLLLLDPTEVAGGRARIGGRRAQHVRSVLHARTGDQLRAGIIGGAVGVATVGADDGTTIELVLALDRGAPVPMPVELVLAMPRPKVLARVIETAAAFAVRRIDVVNAWRVDKAYLASRRLEASALAEQARLGAEQGGTTHVPTIAVHHRLMEFLELRCPAGVAPSGMRLCAHPRGGVRLDVAWSSGPAEPVVLAIGPDGGWIDRELDTFCGRGFVVASLTDAVLRVEAATAAALGQISMLLGASR